MKFLLLKMTMIMSSSILMLKTPMSMGILLLIQTTMSTLIISKIMPNSWLSMIMFLMFVGGLLILFMYMSSIASNEKFTPNLKILIIVMLLIFPIEELMSEMQNLENTNNFNLTNMEMTNMTKIYNKKTFLITIMMFMYMFLTMVVVTSIIKIFKGPLRAK